MNTDLPIGWFTTGFAIVGLCAMVLQDGAGHASAEGAFRVFGWTSAAFLLAAITTAIAGKQFGNAAERKSAIAGLVVSSVAVLLFALNYAIFRGWPT